LSQSKPNLAQVSLDVVGNNLLVWWMAPKAKCLEFWFLFSGVGRHALPFTKVVVARRGGAIVHN